MPEQDRIYRDPQGQIVDFAFDAQVAEVFGDMIRRSVPGYETVVPIAGLLAARHLAELPTARHQLYDLGCSLGACTAAVLHQFPKDSLTVIAVDNSAAMLDRARGAIADPRVRFLCSDICDTELEPAGVVMLNFVLQFIPPERRNHLLEQIRRSLEPDGLLIVSEKLCFDAPAEQAYYEAAHLDYKRANGYSELEISQKRSALENVMIVDSEAGHRQRFADAGFGTVRQWFRCLNWASYLVYCR